MKRHIGLCLLLMAVSISGVLAGQQEAQQGRKLTLRINDSILFAPEFHAYKYGRIKNEKGEGKRWFRRFTIMHISDIHSNFSQLEEALLVSADKADVVANTGDDAHGKRAADAPRVREVLGATSATVRRFNRRPYLQVPGNHDVTGVGELDFVAHLFGHIHSKNDYRCRKSDGTEYDILMLGESAIGWSGTALNRIHMEEGTINDISFSALHVDVQEKAIYRVSYGAFRHYDNPSQARTQKIVYRFGL